LLTSAPAFAESDERVPPIRNALVQKECGSCHMAFQPAFLPAASWNRIMDELPKHFGEDASLPADKTKTIRDYLTANAGDAMGRNQWHGHRSESASSETPIKITETSAFLRKHHFSDRVWKDPKVVTKSNCPACHLAADKGVYEDD
jgi:hypothetical protein